MLLLTLKCKKASTSRKCAKSKIYKREIFSAYSSAVKTITPKKYTFNDELLFLASKCGDIETLTHLVETIRFSCYVLLRTLLSAIENSHYDFVSKLLEKVTYSAFDLELGVSSATSIGLNDIAHLIMSHGKGIVCK